MAESCRGASGIQTKNFRVVCKNVPTFCVCYNTDELGATYDAAYVSFWSAGNGAEYYYWINVDGASVDPAPGGTGIEVAVSSTDTAATIAAAVAAAVNAEADFCALQLRNKKNCVVVKGIDFLPATPATTSDAVNQEVFEEHKGFSQDLGLTGSGGFEINLNTETQEVTCDQTGSLIVSEDIIGVSPELEIVFKECNQALLNKVFVGGIGDECEDSNGDTVQGLGTTAVGRSVISRANRICLVPVENAPDDYTGAITFMLAFPTVSNLNYPSTEAATITATFKGYYDEFSKCEETNILAFGDTRFI